MKKQAILTLYIIVLACSAFAVFGANIAGCKVYVNDSSTLEHDINFTTGDYCIRINASNVEFDCMGYSITVNNSGIGPSVFYTEHQDNITLKGCRIIHVRKGNSIIGVYFLNITNTYIYNNTIHLNGSDWWRSSTGIALSSATRSSNITVENNTLTLNSLTESGISVGTKNTTVIGNYIFIYNGTGISTTHEITGTKILNNNITESDNPYSYVVAIVAWSNDTTIMYNTVSGGGSIGEAVIKIFLRARNNLVAYNNVTTSRRESSVGIAADAHGGSYIESMTNNTIENNTVRIIAPSKTPTGANVTAVGILARCSNHSFIRGNTIIITGNSSPASPAYLKGISLETYEFNGYNYTISYNTIIINNTPGNVESAGIYSEMSDLSIFANNITVYDTLRSGIELVNGAYCRVSGNNIFSYGSGQGFGVLFMGHNQTNFTSNRIFTNGSRALLVNYSDYNYFEHTNITAGAVGIELSYSNGTVFNKTLINNTDTWLNTTLNSQNNFTNTTFAMPGGTINFPGKFVASVANLAYSFVGKQRLNITDNKAFLNSASAPFLNTTGIITLFGLDFTMPKLRVDWNDDGTYENCPADTCTLLSSTGNYVFNVSHFTSFSITQGGLNVTLAKSDSEDPVTAGDTLTYTITITIEDLEQGITNASNLTLTDTYPPEVIFSSSQPTPVSGTNNTFVLGNLTANQTIVVNITVNLPLALADTTINNTANISYNNVNGSQINATVTEPTSVQSAGGGGGSGGGSGGGGGGVYRPLNTTTTPGYCFESWVCGDWSECTAGTQARECTDLKSCGTTALKPKTSQTCSPEIKPLPKAVEEPPAETYEQEPVLVVEPKAKMPALDKAFYALAVIALVALGLYLYWMRRKK